METSHFPSFDFSFLSSISDLTNFEVTHFEDIYECGSSGLGKPVFETEPTSRTVLDDGYMEKFLFMESDFSRDSSFHLSEMDHNLGFSAIQDPMAKFEEMGCCEMNQNNENMVLVEQSNAVQSDFKEFEEKLMEETSLVDLLLEGAQAVEAENLHLASLIIERLEHLLSIKDNGDSPFNRLAFFFTQGLHYKTIKHELVEGLATNMFAFQMLQELSPYIKFAHFTANQAILEATEGEPEVHVVDFNVMEGVQWPPLMVDLALRKVTSLRITAIINKPAGGSMSRTGRRLREFADSIDLDFMFDTLLVEKEEDLEGLEVGKALIVNCMIHQLHIPNRSFASVKDFLVVASKLSPRMVVLVEEDLFNFAKMRSKSFVEFFCEALHHYSALLDSLMSGISGGSDVGLRLIEKEFMGHRIMDSLQWFPSKIEKREAWGNGFLMKGFRAIPMSTSNVSQARLLVGLFDGGYEVQHENCRLSLCWKSRPLTTASIWAPTSD